MLFTLPTDDVQLQYLMLSPLGGQGVLTAVMHIKQLVFVVRLTFSCLKVPESSLFGECSSCVGLQLTSGSFGYLYLLAASSGSLQGCIFLMDFLILTPEHLRLLLARVDDMELGLSNPQLVTVPRMVCLCLRQAAYYFGNARDAPLNSMTFLVDKLQGYSLFKRLFHHSCHAYCAVAVCRNGRGEVALSSSKLVTVTLSICLRLQLCSKISATLRMHH